jgi:hypothetical protein
MKIMIIAVTGILAISLLAGCASLTFPTTICHATGDPANPYAVVTINNVNELLLHKGDTNDIYPVPVSGCPAVLVEAKSGKITICHATGSDKNPYNEITISISGLEGHANHKGDIIPMPAGGCPTTKGEDLKQKGQGKK